MADEAETMDDLFRFLALEVFQKQTPEIGLFMLQTSLLEELTADACNRILERDDSYQLLAKLCSQSLFLAHLGEGLFRYHSLFRDFLQGQFKKIYKEYVRFAHLAAAYSGCYWSVWAGDESVRSGRQSATKQPVCWRFTAVR